MGPKGLNLEKKAKGKNPIAVNTSQTFDTTQHLGIKRDDGCLMKFVVEVLSAKAQSELKIRDLLLKKIKKKGTLLWVRRKLVYYTPKRNLIGVFMSNIFVFTIRRFSIKEFKKCLQHPKTHISQPTPD